MRQAFALLTAAVLSFGGIALTTGCASSGQDENYKMLQEDRPLFDNRPDPSRPGESRAPVSPLFQHVVFTAPEAQPAEAQLQNAPAAEPKADEQTSTEVRQALVVPGVEPSVTGLDRSTWPTVIVTPAPVNVSDKHGAHDSAGRTDARDCCDHAGKKDCCKAGAACCEAKKACCVKKSGCCDTQKADCCKTGEACSTHDGAKSCCATQNTAEHQHK